MHGIRRQVLRELRRRKHLLLSNMMHLRALSMHLLLWLFMHPILRVLPAGSYPLGILVGRGRALLGATLCWLVVEAVRHGALLHDRNSRVAFLTEVAIGQIHRDICVLHRFRDIVGHRLQRRDAPSELSPGGAFSGLGGRGLNVVREGLQRGYTAARSGHHAAHTSTTYAFISAGLQSGHLRVAAPCAHAHHTRHCSRA